MNVKQQQFQNNSSYNEVSRTSKDYRNPQDPEIIDNQETNPYFQEVQNY